MEAGEAAGGKARFSFPTLGFSNRLLSFPAKDFIDHFHVMIATGLKAAIGWNHGSREAAA